MTPKPVRRKTATELGEELAARLVDLTRDGTLEWSPIEDGQMEARLGPECRVQTSGGGARLQEPGIEVYLLRDGRFVQSAYLDGAGYCKTHISPLVVYLHHLVKRGSKGYAAGVLRALEALDDLTDGRESETVEEA